MGFLLTEEKKLDLLLIRLLFLVKVKPFIEVYGSVESINLI